MAGEIIDPNKKATSSVALLDGCDVPVKLPSKCVLAPRDNHCQLQLITTGDGLENKCLAMGTVAQFLAEGGHL